MSNQNRRRFITNIATTIAAAELGLMGLAKAQPTQYSFGPIKQINAGVLNVGYAEVGAANGRPVILLHGWPYDIHSYVDVAPLLSAKGYRVIVPHLRGYGTTSFLSSETVRNGQQAAVAVDANRSATSFDNPDHVQIVIHNYRWRLGLAEGERQYDDFERRLAQGPVINVPTITLEGDANGAPHPDASVYAKKFSGKYAHRLIKGGVGHNLPQEAPQAFAEAIIEVDGY